MSRQLSQRSLNNLKGVHPDLVRVINEAIQESPYDFDITEGLRTIERQKQLVKEGKSQTMNSRHLTGKAVDIVVYVNGEVTWNYKYYKEVATHIIVCSKLNAVPMVWGGDWKTLVDAVHFELDSKFYK